MGLITRVLDRLPSKLAREFSRGIRQDGWQSTLTGLGTWRDKLESVLHKPDPRLTPQQCAALYSHDDMAARIVDQLPLDATRPGLTVAVQTDKPEDGIKQGGEMVKALHSTGAMKSAFQAWKFGRLMGGAAAWVIVDDGKMQLEPLDLDSSYTVRGFHVLELWELRVVKRYDNILDPRFDQPELFAMMTRSGKTIEGGLIHESRLIRFEGIDESDLVLQERLYGWGGCSVLQRPHRAVRNFQSFWSNITHLTQDSGQGVFKIKGLVEALSTGNMALVNKRLLSTDSERSNVRALAVDADMEDFQRNSIQLTGLDGLADRFAVRLAAAARMPVTVLMGQSPAGLNATGESDLRLWYDQVDQVRQSEYLPQIKRLIDILWHAKNGPTGGKAPAAYSCELGALRQMSEAEKATLRKTVADTDAVYIQNGVLIPEEVALSRFTPTGYSTETRIDRELNAELLERERQALKQGTPTPTALPAATSV